jgi:hypothetical protein
VIRRFHENVKSLAIIVLVVRLNSQDMFYVNRFKHISYELNNCIYIYIQYLRDKRIHIVSVVNDAGHLGSKLGCHGMIYGPTDMSRKVRHWGPEKNKIISRQFARSRLHTYNIHVYLWFGIGIV